MLYFFKENKNSITSRKRLAHTLDFKYLKRTSLFWKILAGTIFLMICISLLMPTGGQTTLHNHFSNLPIELQTYDLQDLGVVDANGDGRLDLFTLNHSSRQSLLINQTDTQNNIKFTDTLSDFNLDQDHTFPNAENRAESVIGEAPGLYIYRQNSLLVIKAHSISTLGQIKGVLDVSSPLVTVKQESFQTNFEVSTTSTGAIQTKVKFSLQKNNGELVLDGLVEVPHTFDVNDDFPLANIYIGTNKINPSVHHFDLFLRDRHSMAWADINSDGQIDVFVGRGGIKGIMGQMPEPYYDELFVSHLGNWTDHGSPKGLLKGNCPGRQSAWVDINNDNQLELYNVCGRGASNPSLHPNQLFQYSENGTFIDIAPRLGLDLARDGHFVWLDVDMDGDIDLLSSQDKILFLYKQDNDEFQQEIIGEVSGLVDKFSVADYDMDGDFDIYISTSTYSTDSDIYHSNIVLTNQEGKYRITPPENIGLPSQGVSANWVDYDNDGFLDLHIIPYGLYHQKPNHHFEKSNLLVDNVRFLSDQGSPSQYIKNPKLLKARASWVDIDNDGFRDLVRAEIRTKSIRHKAMNYFIPKASKAVLISKINNNKHWDASMYRNLAQSNNHWLEVKLIGNKKNVEAIGATVKLTTPEGTQLQQVGCSEGSFFSQGHYRLYFGTGHHAIINGLDITWPDGSSQTYENIATDQMLTISQQEGIDNRKTQPSILHTF